MTSSLSKLLLLLCLTPILTNAWTQVRDNNERLCAFRLHSSYADSFHNSPQKSTVLENLYQDDDAVLIGGLYESLTPLPIFEWAENPMDTEWMDFDTCRGDECEQCEIPEDFKNHNNQMDVLGFLGIKRADPID